MNNFLQNWNVIGHAKQLRSLEEDLAAGNLAHAYLFTGPPQLGKYTIAKKFARILQCGNSECAGGTDCATCFSIEKGYHADTIEIGIDGEMIKIDPVRDDILPRLATHAAARYKILLMKNIENMKVETANMLLKTLEEPGSQVIFIFTSSAPANVLATILSRVRVVKFMTVGAAEILAGLQGIAGGPGRANGDDEAKIRAVVDLACGLPGRAIGLLENAEHFEQTQSLFARMRQVLERNDTVEKFALVEEMTKDKKEDPRIFREFCDIFILALRYTMVDEAGRVGAASQKLAQLADAITQTQNGLGMLKNNVNAKLLFENLMLQI